MELISNVVGVEDKFSKSGKPYWTISWGNGTKDNIVNPKIHKTICEAKNAGKKVKIEKERKGEFMTVISAEIVDTPIEYISNKPVDNVQQLSSSTSPQKQQPDDKVKSVALSYAKDIVCAALLSPDDILVWAEIFYRYLNGSLIIDDIKILEAIMKLTRKQ
jgi:hypothetical protein